MSVFMALLFGEERGPEFRRALRVANASQLKEAIRMSQEDPGGKRRLGRLRAALRRLERRQAPKDGT